MRRSTVGLVALVVLLGRGNCSLDPLGGTAYGEPIAAYRIRIGPPHVEGAGQPTPGGVSAPTHLLTPGETYGLTVEIKVEDNAMSFAGDPTEYHGGAFFISFNMDNHPDYLRGDPDKTPEEQGPVAYAMSTGGFPPRPLWKWKSEWPAEFSTFYPGEVAITFYDGEFFSLYQQGGMIPVDDRFNDMNPYAFGGGLDADPEFAPVSWGNFVFTSEETVMTLTPSSPGSTKIYYQAEPDGAVEFVSIYQLYPRLTMEELMEKGILVGDETMLRIIPEPSTLVLLCMGAVGLVTYACRRRKRAGSAVSGLN